VTSRFIVRSLPGLTAILSIVVSAATWVTVAIAAMTIVAVSGAAQSYLQQSQPANDPKDINTWRQGETRNGLKPYPPAPPGTPNPPGGLWQYGGGSDSSFAPPTLGEPFAKFREKMAAQRAKIDAQAQAVLNARYDLRCNTDSSAKMSRGKPLATGPTALLPKSVKTWDEFLARTPDKIRDAAEFPYLPLDHPLHSTAHMVFPKQWTKVHPEHERFDVGFDIPECFLPEFPPALYLTTHLEMGDVSRGVEINYGNYFDMFNGILTSEQLDGLRLMVTPFQTTWFNTTYHRVTREPSAGVSCFSCHVNGHTNGAIELAPDARPNYTRLRVTTPSLRGNYAQLILSSKRSIHTMEHFAEVEEYFDGDTGVLAAIGGRTLQKPQTNHMGDLNSIIDFPPAPKLDALNRLIASKATPQELHGQELFNGKALCNQCHQPTQQFTDNSMHDLQVERFYKGRPEGPIKTFPLRGLKDHPPYLHDGRLLTIEDTVLFFDIILELHLNAGEREDLAAYLKAL